MTSTNGMYVIVYGPASPPDGTSPEDYEAAEAVRREKVRQLFLPAGHASQLRRQSECHAACKRKDERLSGGGRSAQRGIASSVAFRYICS